MTLLLDTHALLWWLVGDPRLSAAARRQLEKSGGETFVSAVSAYEITLKFGLGKLPSAEPLARDFAGTLERQGFRQLPITVAHAANAGALAIPHKDPFDRLLIAQAQLDDLLLVSNEELFDGFGVRRLW